MADRFDLPTFASTCCRLCWEEYKENPENRLVLVHANPLDANARSMGLNRTANQGSINKAIRKFFKEVYLYGAMAQQFGWEEKVGIDWVQRNVWLVSAVENGGPRLICLAYNDTDQPNGAVLEDPPAMGFDNAGLVCNWISRDIFQPLAIRMSDDPRAERLARQCITDYVREKAQNN